MEELLGATLGTTHHHAASASIALAFADSLNTFSTFAAPGRDCPHDRHKGNTSFKVERDYASYRVLRITLICVNQEAAGSSSRN